MRVQRGLPVPAPARMRTLSIPPLERAFGWAVRRPEYPPCNALDRVTDFPTVSAGLAAHYPCRS